MYQDKMVVAIKCGGKVLRETKDLVSLPFGSEFSVLVKNLNSRRVKFTLHIDGTDVLDGEEIIVNANSEVEMKRFIKNGNMDSGNAFKFIERTAKIEEGPRGIKMDDGVVRVQFWFEKQPDQTITTTHVHNDVWWNDYYNRPYYTRPTYTFPWNTTTTTYSSSNAIGSYAGSVDSVKLGSTTTRSVKSAAASASDSVTSGMVAQAMNTDSTYSATSGSTGGSGSNTMLSTNSASFGDFSTLESTPTMDSFEVKQELANEVGITVPGSKVEQKFHTVYGFKSEEISNVIVIRLAGKVGDAPVSIPVTVKSKQKCGTCGHTNKSNAKYCSECGTALEIL